MTRYKVTGVKTKVFIAPSHECTQRIIPEIITIAMGAVAAQGATSLTVTPTANTKAIKAPVWLTFSDVDGAEVDVLVTEDIAPGDTSLVIKPARLRIGATSTAIYPPRIPGMLSLSWEPVGEVDTTVPLDEGGYQVSSYTTLGGSFSLERHWFLDPAWLTCDYAARNKELVWLSIELPPPTCPDDDSYIDGPIREGFFLIEGGTPMDISGDAPIMANINFLLDGNFTKYENTPSLTPTP